MWTRDDQRRITWIFNCDSSISNHQWMRTIRYPCESHLISSLWQVSHWGSATKGSTTCSIVRCTFAGYKYRVNNCVNRQSTETEVNIFSFTDPSNVGSSWDAVAASSSRALWESPQQYVVTLYHHKTGHGRWRSVILDEHTRQCTNYHSLCK